MLEVPFSQSLLMGQEATVGFVIVSYLGTFLLVEGVACAYSGIVPFNNLLTQSLYSLIALTICSLQFLVVGGSLVCQDNTSKFFGRFIGSLSDTLLLKMPQEDSPALVFYLSDRILSMAFSGVSAAIMIGSATQRGRFIPSLIFLTIWLTLVYDPIAYWCWNHNGWSYNMGAIDYAGGTAVHCTAGFTALVYTYHLGPRKDTSRQQPASSFLLVGFGTFLMWCGWVGFNTGSAMRPGVKALRAAINTQISASAGGLTWMLMDHSFDGSWSLIGFCTGVISGLVCVTPAAANVPPWSAVFFGISAGIICNLSTKIKFYLNIDDALDIFAIHGVGGYLGSLLTGVFSDGGHWSPHPGLIAGHPKQILYQFVSASAIVIYTTLMSHLILVVLKHNTTLCIDDELQMVGLDLAEHGEFAFASSETMSSSGPSISMTNKDSQINRYRQTNLNVSMFPDPSETPLLLNNPHNYRMYLSND